MHPAPYLPDSQPCRKKQNIVETTHSFLDGSSSEISRLTFWGKEVADLDMGHEFKASLNLISEIPGPNDSHVRKETAFETVKQTMRQMLEPWKIKARAERAGLLSFL